MIGIITVLKLALFLRYPSQCLSSQVDLIVVTAVRKREQFGDEIIRPGCSSWEVRRAAFEIRLIYAEPRYLIAFGPHGDHRNALAS